MNHEERKISPHVCSSLHIHYSLATPAHDLEVASNALMIGKILNTCFIGIGQYLAKPFLDMLITVQTVTVA